MGGRLPTWVAAGAGLAAWAALILFPLAFLFVTSLTAPAADWPMDRVAWLTLRSFATAGGIAAVSVVLAFVPARLLAGTERGGAALALVLAPLVLPQYVAYYAWWLLLSPTTALGRLLAEDAAVARFLHALTASGSLVLWYWPLAALLLWQGWRALDGDILRQARLDAGPVRRLTGVTLPLLGRSIALAFGVCFVLVLSEQGTFDLAGIETLGTKIGLEMARVYETTGSAGATARAGAPLTIAAIMVAAALRRRLRDRSTHPPEATSHPLAGAWAWGATAALAGISAAAPLVLLAAHVRDAGPWRDFPALHGPELLGSAGTSLAAAAMAMLIAGGALLADRPARAGRILAAAACTTILMATFLPGSLLAVSLLHLASSAGLPAAVRNGWWSVSAGQAARLAGVVLIVLQAARDAADRRLAEMAAVDGATPLQAFRHVHLARVWPAVLGAFLLAALFAMTELSATMVLLPAGVPNFAQGLLNQMHYVRDQQVIASCLVLAGGYAAAAILLVALLRLWKARAGAAALWVLPAVLLLAGCGGESSRGQPDVAAVVGRTGQGDGEFIYPRAIAFATDDTFFVADKTGRIQHFTSAGEFLGGFRMPDIEAGKPTGLTVGPDGNLYVADTHYHRVMVFTPDGRLVRRFGRFGQEGGCFIYPTDVAFAPDGRIFVSEYGGNDRVSVFDAEGTFRSSFGACGDGEGQFARPAALCVDGRRGVLYVADACNHRIARYGLDGRLQGYFGRAGGGLGELRYPYGLALTPEGGLVVCEYGNNRVQWFDPDGRALAVRGGPGREPGRLAYPWGVALDGEGRLFVIDAGNNRVQVWRP